MRIGILGGTFDPIHRGHTSLAGSVLQVFSLDRVLFLVSPQPPHKGKGKITSPFHRYAMTALDLIDEPRFHPCPWELEQEKVCYTIETLHYFRTSFPENQYCFIAGSDSLKEIHLWKDCDKLLKEHCFVFVQRPGTEVELERLQLAGPLKGRIQLVPPQGRPHLRGGQSYLVFLNTAPVSSTAAREMIAAGQWPPPEMISPSVLQYIRKHGLYEKNESRSQEGLPSH